MNDNFWFWLQVSTHILAIASIALSVYAICRA